METFSGYVPRRPFFQANDPAGRGGTLMSRAVSMPLGSWPLEMRAERAAAYCDEPSVEAFHRKVQLGIYSQPSRQIGCLPKWHRHKLDHDIARRHGLQMPGPQLVEDAADLI
jgi:hypothetical protein